jgi:hypothetical protein
LGKAVLVEECPDLGGITHVLRHGDHREVQIGAVGKAIKRRQLGNAGCAPGRPEIDQCRLALQAWQAKFVTCRILERDVGKRAAFVAAIYGAGKFARTSVCRSLRLRLLPALPIAAACQQGKAKDGTCE